MTRKTKQGALEQLAALGQAVHEAERLANVALAERMSSARWLDAARAELGAYITDVGNAKRDRDAKVERELRDKVTDLEAMRVEIDRRGDAIRYADRRAVERHEDAMLAAQEAEHDRIAFIVAHRHDLEAELLEQSLVARDRLIAAVEDLSSAQGAWSAVARQWRGMFERWGESPATIPTAPLPADAMQDIELVIAQVRGGAKDPRGIIPAPATLTAADGEERHETPLRGWEHRVRVVSSATGLGA